MAGQLDSLLKSVAKQVVADLGDSFDSSIVYTKKASGSYNTSTGVYSTSDTTYSVSKLLLSLFNLLKMMVEKEEKQKFI